MFRSIRVLYSIDVTYLGDERVVSRFTRRRRYSDDDDDDGSGDGAGAGAGASEGEGGVMYVSASSHIRNPVREPLVCCTRVECECTCEIPMSECVRMCAWQTQNDIFYKRAEGCTTKTERCGLLILLACEMR